jgi:hypothetical protein
MECANFSEKPLPPSSGYKMRKIASYLDLELSRQWLSGLLAFGVWQRVIVIDISEEPAVSIFRLEEVYSSLPVESYYMIFDVFTAMIVKSYWLLGYDTMSSLKVPLKRR